MFFFCSFVGLCEFICRGSGAVDDWVAEWSKAPV